MRKTVEKTILTIDALNILSWVESPDGFFTKEKLPLKIMWDFKDNFKTLIPIRDKYNEFIKKLEQKYSDDEHSYECEETNENGEKNIIRKVKEEYINDFRKEQYELLALENRVNVKIFDIDDFGNINVNVQEMSMLSFFMEE